MAIVNQDWISPKVRNTKKNKKQKKLTYRSVLIILTAKKSSYVI